MYIYIDRFPINRVNLIFTDPIVTINSITSINSLPNLGIIYSHARNKCIQFEYNIEILINANAL